MKIPTVPALMVANATLGFLLGFQLRSGGDISPPTKEAALAQFASPTSTSKNVGNKVHPWAHVATTPFEKIYSDNPVAFTANLRRIGCPEETVKDIVQAQVNKKYRSLEEQLRPLPADHVPWSWSPNTSEGKLIDRRQQAAGIAREKEQILRAALGYDGSVTMPQYAMTSSDEAFRKSLAKMPEDLRRKAQTINEAYWAGVQDLRSRTKGFWEPEDVEALNELKNTRNQDFQAITGATISPEQ